jgi:Caspase domain
MVIGINSYQNLETLNGAAEDARAIAAYLQQDLATASGPNDNVSILTDEKATRAAFISGLTSLASNGAIKAGDPIVIYFAGHVSEEGDSEIPNLLLYDWTTQKATESISSGELHELLTKIQQRSDNIVGFIHFRMHYAYFMPSITLLDRNC